MNNPSHHRVHHGRNHQYIDKNYGGTMIIFDRIFGTFEPEKEDVIFGITHSLNTWNPLIIQFHHLYETYQAMVKTPGLFNKMRVLLDRGPGYNFEVLYPKEYSNPQLLEAKDAIRYDSKMPNLTMTLYGFIHSMFLFAGAFLVLKFNWPLMEACIYSLYIIFGMCTISALFDRKTWAVPLEIFRLVLFVAWFLWNNQWDSSQYSLFVGLLFVASLGTLLTKGKPQFANAKKVD